MAQFYYLLILLYISESTQKIGAWVFIHFVLHLFCTLLLYLIYVHYNQRDFDLIRIRITNESERDYDVGRSISKEKSAFLFDFNSKF